MPKLQEFDRRWIFLLVAVALAVTVYWSEDIEQPITPSPSVEAVYRKIENLPEGSAVFIATDFDPQSRAELVPITRAVLNHCFQQDLKVLGMTFWPQGGPLGNRLFRSVAAKYDKQSGEDFVYFGYKPGAMAQVITNMGEDLTSAFPQDANNQPTANMPILQDIENLRDVDYMLDMAAGETAEPWIVYGADKYGFPMAAGCTAVVAPNLYVFMNTGQLNGIIAGLRGAADYEVLLGQPARGVQGMPAQSTVHGIIILFVIMGNAIYFWRRTRRGGRRP